MTHLHGPFTKSKYFFRGAVERSAVPRRTKPRVQQDCLHATRHPRVVIRQRMRLGQDMTGGTG